ncbi:MAG: FHA domain-containing protein [Oscillospiraceae bacterium]|jgi:pSer/pThr/pTyr-binding forkhead associated (FHA) protein|nr:FHA domain-containing protein [Oscillospiraceae bacterium]
MEFFSDIGRYFMPVAALFIVINCAIPMMKGNKKTGVIGYLVNSANGDKILLQSFETSIGRSNSCDIVLVYGTVSRFHAVVSRYRSGWFLSDNNSKTGTFVETGQIEKRERIKNGDTVAFGNVVFTFFDRYEEEKKSNQTPPPQEEEPPVKLYETEEKFYTAEVFPPESAGVTSYLINELTRKNFSLDELQTCLIGRNKEAQIHIDFPAVSRFHALLSRQGEEWIIEDLDSTAGTKLNGKTLESVKKLYDGDVIDISGTTLVFKTNR